MTSSSIASRKSKKIIPTGRQTDVIYLKSTQDAVVLGTAGTGKSIMAVLRARFLANPGAVNHGPVLLVTYNNTLIQYLRYLTPDPSDDIHVETYSKFARGYLNSVGKMPPRNGIVESDDKLSTMVANAVREVRKRSNSTNFPDLDARFFAEEIIWIADMGITDREQYLNDKRSGRKLNLDKSERKTVWEVRTEYRKTRKANNILYDWHDIATAVLNALKVDNRERRYHHIVIDEGQDLSPEAIRSLKAAVPKNGTVSFFGDYHQQIYKQGISFRECGLKITQSNPIQRFRDNYRNTAQIARVAIAMSDMPYMDTVQEDLVEPKEPTAAGAMPTLIKCRDRRSEITEIQRIANHQRELGVVGILTRTWDEAKMATRGIDNTRCLQRHRGAPWDPTCGIYYGTYHSAKGLEFDVVLMPFCTNKTQLKNQINDASDTEKLDSKEGKLLYVAITRARTELTVTYSGQVTPLLPARDGLWKFEDLS